MRSRCVSITGATGFIGAHAMRAFRSREWIVRAIVRPHNRKPVLDASAVREAELTDAASLAAAFAGSDVVVHLAGQVRAASAAQLAIANVDGTRAVVTAANAVSARVVHVSSLAASGPGTAARPVREADAPQPITAYGRSKLAGETVVRDLAAHGWIILRPSAVYGPADRGFLPLARLANRGVFLLAAAQEMPFTFAYVEDVAAAIVRAAESPITGEILFVGHPTVETTGTLLRGLAAAVGRSYRPVRIPRAVMRSMAALGDLSWKLGATPLLDSARFAEFTAPGFVCDVSRAHSLLGLDDGVSLAEGLPRTVAWYRQHGWL